MDVRVRSGLDSQVKRAFKECTKKKVDVMGILNVTPDSFSDGGAYCSVEKAVQRAQQMMADGATIIDVGGESTRPGAQPVSLREEWERVIPVIEALVSLSLGPISIDTYKAPIAEAAVVRGAQIINDTGGGEDPKMLDVVRRYGVSIILMHRKGVPATMQSNPEYPQGVVPEIRDWFLNKIEYCRAQGIESSRIWLDPGIGFGKTLEHNLEIMRSLKEFVGLGHRVVIGTSRKSFLSRVLGFDALPIADRLPGTLISNLWAYEQGVSVFRVHDVKEWVSAMKTWEAIYGFKS